MKSRNDEAHEARNAIVHSTRENFDALHVGCIEIHNVISNHYRTRHTLVGIILLQAVGTVKASERITHKISNNNERLFNDLTGKKCQGESEGIPSNVGHHRNERGANAEQVREEPHQQKGLTDLTLKVD